MLKTNAGFQKVMHMHIFYSLQEWQKIYDRDVSQSHKLLIMAERCRRLGIVRPSERSVAAIVSILYGDATGVIQAGPGALQAVREFKTILHSHQGDTQATLFEIPESPSFLQQHHGGLYADNYGDAPLVKYPGGEVKPKYAHARMPCRETNGDSH